MPAIEISMPVQLAGWHYDEIGLVPPLARPSIDAAASIEEHGFEAHTLTLPTAGACTYLETSGHMLARGPRLLDRAASDLVFEVSLLRLGSLEPEAVVTRRDLEAASAGRAMRGALLVDTGWDAWLQRPGYVARCPRFHSDTLSWFAEQELTLLGVDVPVMEGPESRGKLLKPLFEQRNILLLAPVVNLARLSGGPATLITLPIAVAEVSGAPCRALVLDGLAYDETRVR